MIYIFLFSGLIILFTMYFINLSATKPNNNVVIGVTLPYMQLKDEKVLEIINRFKKENKYFYRWNSCGTTSRRDGWYYNI